MRAKRRGRAGGGGNGGGALGGVSRGGGNSTLADRTAEVQKAGGAHQKTRVGEATEGARWATVASSASHGPFSAYGPLASCIDRPTYSCAPHRVCPRNGAVRRNRA